MATALSMVPTDSMKDCNRLLSSRPLSNQVGPFFNLAALSPSPAAREAARSIDSSSLSSTERNATETGFQKVTDWSQLSNDHCGPAARSARCRAFRLACGGLRLRLRLRSGLGLG